MKIQLKKQRGVSLELEKSEKRFKAGKRHFQKLKKGLLQKRGVGDNPAAKLQRAKVFGQQLKKSKKHLLEEREKINSLS